MTQMQKLPSAILIVEDSDGDFFLISDHLSEAVPGAELHRASTYREAAAASAAQEFDLIFLDLALPDREGTPLVRDIIALAGKTPVVVLTGLSDKKFGPKAIGLGAADYIEKSEISPPFLLKTITYTLERKNITSRLEESEREYRLLFDLSPIPMWVYDLETLAFLRVNRAATDHYGFSESEFLKMTLRDIRPESEITLVEKVTAALKKKKTWQGRSEYLHRKKNGEVIEVLVKGSSFVYKGIRAELIHAIDITEKKRNERALERAYSRLKKAESIGMLGYWERDLETDKLFWSDEFYTVTGLEKTSAPPDFDAFLNLIHRDDMAGFISGYRSLRTGLHTMDIEHRIICPDGRTKFVRQKGNTVRTAEGKAVRTEGIIQDITDRKADELKLLLRESVIANMKEAVMITECNGYEHTEDRAVFVNNAFTEITGYLPEDILGKSSEFLFSGDEDKLALERYRDANKTRKPLTLEFCTVRRSGESYWMSFSMAPVPNSDGEYTHRLIIMRDITERREYLNLLKRQNKRLKEIAFTQSHIVRAPLSRLMGLVNVMLTSGKEDPDFDMMLGNVGISAQELDEVIQNIVGKAVSDIQKTA